MIWHAPAEVAVGQPRGVSAAQITFGFLLLFGAGVFAKQWPRVVRDMICLSRLLHFGAVGNLVPVAERSFFREAGRGPV